MVVGWFAAITAVCTSLASSPDYRPLLLVSLVSALVALVCAAFEYRAGGWLRVESILIALAAAFALVEFALRAPATFR